MRWAEEDTISLRTAASFQPIEMHPFAGGDHRGHAHLAFFITHCPFPGTSAHLIPEPQTSPFEHRRIAAWEPPPEIPSLPYFRPAPGKGALRLQKMLGTAGGKTENTQPCSRTYLQYVRVAPRASPKSPAWSRSGSR